MSKVAVPGVELADDDMWQVVETEQLKREDYNRILDMGWPDFSMEFMQENILNYVPLEFMPPQRKLLDVKGAWREVGLPVLMNEIITTPLELLCGARSMERPEKYWMAIWASWVMCQHPYSFLGPLTRCMTMPAI
jgi:hypothetical protein